jgi:hypothetical protein
MVRFCFAILAAALVAAPLPAAAAAKFKKTHLGVSPNRIVSLFAVVDASSFEFLTPDASGIPLLLQKFTLVVTDVIVTPVAAQDTTTPIWVSFTFGGRGFELRRLGAQTHTVSFAGGMTSTPNQPLGVSNHSTVQLEVNVLGYTVDGLGLATGELPPN